MSPRPVTFVLALLALLTLLAAPGCKRSEEACQRARARARTAWLRYRVALRSRVESNLDKLQAKLRQAREKHEKIKKIQACTREAALAGHDGPEIPARCLAAAKMKRLPSLQESIKEMDELKHLQQTHRQLEGETKRIDRVDEAIRKLDCPPPVALRAAGRVPAVSGPEAPMYKAARRATEELGRACADVETSGAPAHCKP
jgi:hypothetical protein